MPCDRNVLTNEKYAFTDLVALSRLQVMLENFSEITGFSTELVSFPEQTLLIQTRSYEAITKILKACPKQASLFRQTRLALTNQLQATKTLCIHHCKNELVLGAIPVVVEGLHLADFFSGYVFFEHPDHNAAQKLSEQEPLCESEIYLEALREIPVVAEAMLRKSLEFLAQMVSALALKGLAELREREAKKLIQQNEENLLTTLNSIGDAVISTDLNGNIVRINRVAESLTGYRYEEVKGKPLTSCFSIFHAKTGKLAEDPVQKVLEIGEIVALSNDTVLISKQGKKYQIADSAAPIKGSDGKTTGVVLVFRDVSEEYKMRQKLKENEKRLKQAQRIAKIGDFTWNVTTGKIRWSESLFDILQYDKSEAIDYAKVNAEIHHPQDLPRVTRWLNDAIASGKNTLSPNEYRLIRKDGHIIYVRATGVIVRDENNSVKVFATAQDITEQKEAERERAALASFVQNSQDIIVVKDLNRRVVATNMAFTLAADRKSISEMLGKTDAEIFNIPEDADPIRAYMLDDLKAMNLPAGEMLVREEPVIFPGGEVRTFLTRKFPIRDDAGNPIYVGIISNDITERKEANRLLIESEARFRQIYENISAGIAAVSLGFRIISANQAYCQMLGYSEQELIGKHLSEFTHPESLEENINQQTRLAAGEIDHFRMEKQFIHKSGKLLYGILDSNLIRNLSGEPIYFLGSVVDITEKKAAEEEIRASEAKYKSLFEGINDAAFVHPIDEERKNFIEVNETACKYLEYTREELLKLSPKDLTPTTDVTGAQFRGTREIRAILLKEKQIVFEIELETKSGKRIPVEISTRVFHMGGVPFALSLARDITERKRTEQELHRMEKLESIGTLAGGIAHDFNNLLMGIFGKISLAKTALDKTHPAARYLDGAEQAMNRATRLTKQLLTFSKGGAPLKEHVNIFELVEEITRFDLSGSNVKALFNQPQNLWLADVDKGQIQQAFSNLIINASQAMPRGGHLYITFENRDVTNANKEPNLEAGKYVKITVQDEGVGIDKKNIDYIFDPYFTTKQSGSGLGLTTTYSIIKKHGGTIHVESELGVGTSVTLFLPASKKKQFANPSPPSETFSLSTEEAKILVMDDEELILEIVSHLLKSKGFEVEAALDGCKAIELYQKAFSERKPFDAVIMDLTVPGGMGGKDAINGILEIDPNAKVIVSSGYTNDSVMSNYSQYGFKGIVEKPYTLKTLMTVLQAILSE
ncbi:PAS/PAC sensor hybrid histidine kinase [Chloroherpeton thalassium ATCC 35110]|uniref:histidine kinase n=1 Tax=Chloroherpeton thalassium (strain ATCC 35110 / GB-78) TaxID=517418 RepID=B3QW32_CHLT3|nr:PAS domain S-box protein [Chloroherpeton thalassium]ACF14686.1 PAS/PAC sensor hybrid histidine kinase [Chloroherpeton thalassium ATCC 35110]